MTQAQKRSVGRSLQPRRMLAVLLVFGLAALGVGVLDVLLHVGRAPMQISAVDRAATVLLRGFHGVERDRGAAFRWTTSSTYLDVFQHGVGPQVLQLDFGPPVAEGLAIAMQLGDSVHVTAPADTAPRRYAMLVPPDAFSFGTLHVGIASATRSVPPDTRQVGLRFQAVTLRAWGGAWPAASLFGAQVLLLGVCVLLLHRFGMPTLWLGAAALLVAALLAALFQAQPVIAHPYLQRGTLALAILAALSFWLLPHAERLNAWIGPPQLVRAIWGVAMLACAVRLAGAVYPLFNGYDLALNTDRLIKVLSGTLVITRPSIEFRNGTTVYPPGPYLAFLPALLLGFKPAMVVQGCIALFDGLATLPIAVLARRLGASGRTTVLVALLYAAVPINLTALWFGLTAQVFGQALMAPIALAVLGALRRNAWRWWLVAGALLLMAMLSHIGVAILAVAWLGLVWLLLRVRRAVPLAMWWRITAVGAASGLLSVLLIYIDVAALHLQQALVVGEKVASRSYVPAYNLILRGFQIAFSPWGFALVAPALVLLARKKFPRGGLDLAGGWLIAVALFWAIEMYSGLQVRYIFFLTPIACLAVATLLGEISQRGHAARVCAWAVVLLVVVQSSSEWLYNAFENVQPSMVSLLR